MEKLHHLSDAQVILLAAQVAADSNFEILQLLAIERKDLLSKVLLFRILLTFWPVDESTIIPLRTLLKNVEDDFSNVSPLDGSPDPSLYDTIPKQVPSQQTQLLSLLPFNASDTSDIRELITEFIISWTHRLESLGCFVGTTNILVEEFGLRCPKLEAWSETYLQPILRLQYQLYPGVSGTIGLQELENMSGTQGVKALLHCAEQSSEENQIARDLNEVVAPWVRGSRQAKRRRLNDREEITESQNTSWQNVNEWLLSKSIEDFNLTAEVFLRWQGPRTSDSDDDIENVQTVRSRYAQTAFSVIYAQGDASADLAAKSKLIMQKATGFVGLRPPDISSLLQDLAPMSPSLKITPADFLHNALLHPENNLTNISTFSANFLAGVLTTVEVLNLFKILMAPVDVAKQCLFASVDQQKQNMRKILQQIPRLATADVNWQEVRQQLFWLRNWHTGYISDSSASSDSNPLSYLSHLDMSYMDVEILDSILSNGQLKAAKETFFQRNDSLLTPEKIEQRIVTAIFEAYDNASNGNLHRGGMKKAYELLRTFRPNFPNSTSLRHIDHLIKATHSLSFYRLTLQHGVPFQPVNIRVHKDPLALVGKVLEQDSKAYTKLDDLIEIGRNLVFAGLPNGSQNASISEPTELKIFNAERKITYLAIISALSAHDFDTAYSYITTRLTNPFSQSTPTTFVDDMSWRAAYAAGKYRPPTIPQSLHARISSLSKRMDLLSLALTLAPNPESLSEILGTWRRCEEEMDGLKAQAIEEERSFEVKSAGVIPGGFGPEDRDLDAAETRQAMAHRSLANSSVTYEEEAPMGLFDVAKGAANALHRSAFPLSGASLKGFKVGNQGSNVSDDPYDRKQTVSRASTNEGERIRKRDMVSNMVTGGLRSGMGWVLGAQPVERHVSDEQDSQ